MIKEFFADKFEYDLQSNLAWIKVMEEHEDELNDFIQKSLSHILNVHHIWNSRLLEQIPESASWDKLPLLYADKFALENYRTSISFLEQTDLDEKINYHDEEGVPLSRQAIDVLYHILNHSNYHRAQISRELRDLGITPPSFNFIAYR